MSTGASKLSSYSEGSPVSTATIRSVEGALLSSMTEMFSGFLVTPKNLLPRRRLKLVREVKLIRHSPILYAGRVVTDLVQIERLGEKKRAENERFRKHLKRHPIADRRVRRLAEEIESQFDCSACANCCKVATARVTDRDVAKLSKYLRISLGPVCPGLHGRDADEGLVLRRTEAGCVFLKGISAPFMMPDHTPAKTFRTQFGATAVLSLVCGTSPIVPVTAHRLQHSRSDQDRDSVSGLTPMLIDFTGKSAFVTGGSNGIGLACAERPFSGGAVVTIYRPRSRIRRTIARSFRGRGISGDVRDIAALGDAIGEARPDVVVINAGMVAPAPLLKVSDEDWLKTIEVNLTGAWRTLRAPPKFMTNSTPGRRCRGHCFDEFV